MGFWLVISLWMLFGHETDLLTQGEQKSDVTLHETLLSGTSLDVSQTVNLKGTLTELRSGNKQSVQTAIWASGSSRYRERILDVSSDNVVGTARRYMVASLDKRHGDTKQRIATRPTTERVVVRRADDRSTIFSPDGPLTAPELDMLRAEPFTPALKGLLPQRTVRSGDQWLAKSQAASELTGVEPIQSGGLKCVLRELKSSDDATYVRVDFSGSLSGPTDQGPTRMTVEGHFLFDLDHQLISYVLMNGRSEILDGSGRMTGQLEGRYELTRRLAIDDPRLTADALAGLGLKATPDTTALLFDGPKEGVRFLYPRNWELASVAKNIIQLEEPTGGAIRLTLDSSPAPTADKLRSELMGWLKSQKATIKEPGAIEPFALAAPRKADRFTVRAELNEKPKEWLYIFVRQGDRTATVAANILSERADAIRTDVASVARTLEFLPKPQ